MKVAAALIAALLVISSVPAWAVNDISIHINYPYDVVWAGEDNIVEFWFTNSYAVITGMTAGFEFTSTAGSFQWQGGYGNKPSAAPVKYLRVESQFIGAFNIGWSADANQLPGRFLFGGAAAGGGVPLLSTSTRFATMKLLGSQLTDTLGTFCVDNIFFPPAGTWEWASHLPSINPDFQGQPSDGLGSAPPVCFPVVKRWWIKGDANGDGNVSIADVVFIVNYIFASGPAPNPVYAADANCDGSVSIADWVYLVNYIFVGGPAPC